MEKYLGLSMVLLSWAAGAYLLTKWPGMRTMSISQRAASAPGAAKLFAATLILAGFVFYYWLMTWFTARLQLPVSFQIALTVAFIGQVIAAIVPDSVGWRRITHRIAAYAMAVLFVPLSIIITLSDEISPIAVLLGVIGISYMVGSWFLYLFVKKSRDHYLIFQSLYIITFQTIVLVGAFLS